MPTFQVADVSMPICVGVCLLSTSISGDLNNADWNVAARKFSYVTQSLTAIGENVSQPEDIIFSESTSSALLEVAMRHSIPPSALLHSSPISYVLFNMEDFVAVDASRVIANYFVENTDFFPFALPLLRHNNGDCTSHAMQLMTALSFRSNRFAGVCLASGFLPIIRSFLRTAYHSETCTLLATILGDAWLSQFPLEVLSLSKPTRMASGYPIDLSGLYHMVMVYDDYDLSGNTEKCILKFTVDSENGSVSGHGVDTIGKFTIEPVGDLNFDATSGCLRFLKKYENNRRLTLRFEGIVSSMCFGGSFGLENEDPSAALQVLGFWVMAKDSRDSNPSIWTMLQGKIAVEATLRQKWGVLEPWRLEQPSEISQQVGLLRVFSSQSFIFLTDKVDLPTILSSLQQLPQMDSEDAELIRENLSIVRGRRETDAKYANRVNLISYFVAMTMELRANVSIMNIERLKKDLPILRNPEHDKFYETRIYWIDLLSIANVDRSIDPQILAQELTNILQLYESLSETGRLPGAIFDRQPSGRIRDADSDGDDDNDNDGEGPSSSNPFARIAKRKLKSKRSGNSSISTSTFLAISALGIAALTIGAFFVGRVLGSNRD